MNTEALRRAHAETTQEMLDWQRDCGLPHPPTTYTLEYRKALHGHNAEEMFSLGYVWQDKPHRLVFDLCSHIEALAHKEVPALLDRIEALEAENARLREDLAKANGAQWFYLGDDCSSDKCRFSIDECIDEDFLHYNRAEGRHAVLISGARAVPDMWLALTFLTEEEKDEREDDGPYTFTIHASEEDARAVLGEQS